jgi:formate hydrogenlyase transcriptional activator
MSSSRPHDEKLSNSGKAPLSLIRNQGSNEEQREPRHYETLLDASELLPRCGSLPALFDELARILRVWEDWHESSFSIFDAASHTMRVYLAECPDHKHDPTDWQVDDCAGGYVWRTQEPLVVPHRTLDFPFFSRAVVWLHKKNLKSYCILPLTTVQERFGAMGVGSRRANDYTPEKVALLRRVADFAAHAVENVVTREARQSAEKRLGALSSVVSVLNSSQPLRQVFPLIANSIRSIVPAETVAFTLYEKTGNSILIGALDSPLIEDISGTRMPFEHSITGIAFHGERARIFTHAELSTIASPLVEEQLKLGVRSACAIPLIHGQMKLGALILCGTRLTAFPQKEIALLEQIAAQIAASLDHERMDRLLDELSAKLLTEQVDIGAPVTRQSSFDEIVGDSEPLKRALGHVRTVAPTNSTVLILGETGTGKELIARAVHRLSSRAQSSFIKLNCAAIPTGLLESELFGHEKGAFTGAVSQKIGRLELANHGTLFLDEVGEIPMELQPKLLRVLQDQEFERLGGTRTIRVDARLVAATNRDLAQSVADRTFRADLYYRLNVFPITSPPLRERGKDIPLLVRHFVHKFCQRMNKHIASIPSDTMRVFINWHWPGNVRELENFIERCVILTQSEVLYAPLAELMVSGPGHEHGTLESVERDHILRALRQSEGVIAGIHGAAARLGLKRTTLQSRMQKMGIDRSEFES